MEAYQEPKYEIKEVDGQQRLVNRQSGVPIPEDEPLFILRARDVYAALIIQEYAQKCCNGPHKNAVAIRAEQFQNWAMEHPDRMKEPDSQLDAGWTTAGNPKMAPKAKNNPK